MKSVFHGECQLNKIKTLPQGVELKKTTGEYQIVAESEVTGNHHVIDLKDGVEFYEKDGVLYMKNDVETQVRCVIADRHDSVTLETGVWQVGFQQEYDYLTMEKRIVAD